MLTSGCNSVRLCPVPDIAELSVGRSANSQMPECVDQNELNAFGSVGRPPLKV